MHAQAMALIFAQVAMELIPGREIYADACARVEIVPTVQGGLSTTVDMAEADISAIYAKTETRP